MPLTATRLEIARAELRAQLLERGGDGQLHNLTASLAEDGYSVMVFANYFTNDDPAFTCYRLDTWTSQREFDEESFVRWFGDGGVAQ